MLKKWFNISKDFKQEAKEEVSIEPQVQSVRKGVRSLIDGSFFGNEVFVNNLVFLFFLAFLGVIYIANDYRVDALVRREAALQRENSRLRSRQVVITFQLLKETQLSKVQEVVDTNKMGLKILSRPPYVIEIDEQ